MVKHLNETDTIAELRRKIQSAFPDAIFSGQITPADGETGEDFDEQQALYGALCGKRWSEVPASFIKPYADSMPLLTEEAFVVFLPAWLLSALDDCEVRRAVVYTFSRQRDSDDTSFMDCRIQSLSGPQREAVRAFLAYAVDVESSKSIQVSARHALKYVSAFG